MRRFYAFLIMAFSLMAIVIFNIQGQYYSFRSGLEYSTGTEVTYKITPNDDDTDFSIQEVADIFTSRLEASGAKDYYVYTEEDLEPDMGGEPYYQITVRLAGMENSLTNILRSLETYGDIWITTQDNTRTEDGNDIVRGSARVTYEGAQAIVTVETTNAFKDDVGSNLDLSTSESENSEEGEVFTGDYLIVWTNYVDNVDSYEDACKGLTLEQQKMQDKILCVLEGSSFSRGDENNAPTIRIENIGFVASGASQNLLNADSAHSVERVLNSPEVNFSITRLHADTISAQYGNDALLKVSLGALIAFLVVAIILIVCYGVGGFIGSIALMLSLFLITAVYNFFNLALSPAYLVGYVVAIGIGGVIITSYLERLKNELYKGRNPSKACKESFKKGYSTALDATIFTLLTSIALALFSRNSIINFALYLIIAAIISIPVCLFVTRILLYWFCNSKMALHKKLFRVKVDQIPDVNKEESQTYFGSHEKYDATKHQKKSFIGFGILSLVSIVSIVLFSVVSTTFRYTTEFDSYTTIQIVDRNGEEHFATEKDVYDFYDQFNMEPSNVNISIVTDPNDIDQEDQVYYVNASFRYVIDENDANRENILQVLSDDYELEFVLGAPEDETYDSVYFLTIVPQVSVSNFNNALLLILITSICAIIYIVVRFRYTFTIPSLVITILTVLITTGIISLIRLPVSSNVGIALLAGVLITTLLEFVPLVRYGQLIKEGKTKTLVYEDRKEYISIALRRSITGMFLTYGSVMLGALALLLISPSEMYSLYLVTMLCSTIGFATILTLFVPLYLFSEKHLRLRFLKKLAPHKSEKAKRKQEAREKRNAVEPEEVIYPGIND